MTGVAVVRWGKTLLVVQLTLVLIALSVFSIGLHTLTLSKKFNHIQPPDTIVVAGKEGPPANVDYEQIKAYVRSEIAKIPPAKDGKDAVQLPPLVGEPGKSAYQLWLDQGNVGSIEDFFNSLKGPQGDPGPPGPKVELRTNNITGDLEWRYSGTRIWNVLLESCHITEGAVICPGAE